MSKYKVILDTDIGDDIDDAFALALMTKMDVDIIGVTTVYRNTRLRAKMTAKYLKVANYKTSVYKGVENPIKEPIHLFEKDKPNSEGELIPSQYDESYETMKFEDELAVDFIIRKAHELENKLILVPIGPLTNIAMAIEKDPSIKQKVKKIVLMGGWFTEEKPEWNILCDPEAADIVFRSGIKVYAVGLDVTLQCTFEDDLIEILRSRKDSEHKLLTKWFDRWRAHFSFPKSVMHDPLAVMTLIHDVCVFEEKKISVDLKDKRGATLIDNVNGSTINVATKVDRDQFYKLFRGYLFEEKAEKSVR